MKSKVAVGLLALSVFPACREEDAPEPPDFAEVALDADAAFLAVAGTSDDDVWLVGARPSATEAPRLLHRTPEGWDSIDSGQRHDLWWVHTFAGGPTFVAGAGATVLRIEDDVVERTPTPPFFCNTVYGVWGATPEDLWAVGGFAGRDGFVWRWDGQTWIDVALPDDLPRNSSGEIPALFKVWGRIADDVWIVGGLGTVLHYDGTSLQRVPVETDTALFTVTGDDDEVVIVGGSGAGVLLRGGLDGFVDDTPPDAPLLQAVTLDRDGRIIAAGGQGFAVREDGDRWTRLDLGLSAPVQSIHAVWAGDRDLWSVGGNVLSPTLDGGVACSTAEIDDWAATPPEPPSMACPAELVDIQPEGSIARRWN